MRAIAEFRASHARPGATSHDASEFAPVTTEIILLDGGPTLVALAAVRVPGATARLDDSTSLLVRTKRLDAGLIGVFEKMSGVAALAFDAEAPHGDRDVHSLIDAQGRIVGWLSWHREHPTMDAVVRLLPLLGAVAAMLVLFAASAIRQIGRATRRLETSEAEAHKIAYEDPVTGLPNRRRMLDLLDAALAQRAGGGVSFGLLKIDHFADIKETLGEEGSDELLAAAGERLRGAMPPTVTLGRVGPSEFALVATDADGADGLAAAQAAVTVMARPLWIANQAVQSGATVGLVHAPDDGEAREELLRRADLARRSIEPGSALRIAGFDPGHGEGVPGPPVHQARAAPRADRAGLRRALPADRRRRRAADRRRRGAAALEPPDARHDPARRVHPGRRADRADGAARRVRAAPRARRRGALAGRVRRRSTSRRSRCATAAWSTWSPRCSPTPALRRRG